MKVEVAVPGFPVPNNPYGLCGRKATFEEGCGIRDQEQCDSRRGRPGFPVFNSPYGLRGREATLKKPAGEVLLNVLRCQLTY